MTQSIDGKHIANQVIEKVKEKANSLQELAGIHPGLAVIIVGNNPASQVYVSAKSKKAKECGFYSVQHDLEENIPENEIVDLIKTLNKNPKIHGILIQLPLPEHINENRVIQEISVDKDVDGFNFTNIGKLCSGFSKTAFVPCTPAGAMLLIRSVRGINLSGLNALVVGRSNIVGKPMAHLLLAADCTVTLAHSKTRDLPSLCRTADILIAAVGRSKMIKGDWIKTGATVIDVGINRISVNGDKTILVGDVDYEEAFQKAGAITPVPGGAGPMTIAMLMANTLIAAYLSQGLERPDF